MPNNLLDSESDLSTIDLTLTSEDFAITQESSGSERLEAIRVVVEVLTKRAEELMPDAQAAVLALADSLSEYDYRAICKNLKIVKKKLEQLQRQLAQIGTMKAVLALLE